MIIEYLNESADILGAKVSREELTLEEAQEAYNDIRNRALDEMNESIIESVNEGVISVNEAILIAEMCGVIDPGDIYIEEFLYDLSGLTSSQKKEITDKLNSMSPSQRKAAEKALAEKYPDKDAIEAKKQKRKDMLKKAAIAGGVAAGVGLTAYGAKKAVDNNRAKKEFNFRREVEGRSISKANPDYEPILNKFDSDMANLNRDKERDLKDIEQLLPHEQRAKREKWDKKESELKDKRDADIARKRSELITKAGSEDAYYDKLKGRDAEISKIKMLNKDDKEAVKNTEQENIDYAKAHRAQSLFNGIKNAAGNTAIGKKLGLRNDYRTYGVTNKQINKKFKNDTKNKNIDIDKETDSNIRSVYRGDKDNQIPDYTETKPKKKGLFGKK